MMNADVRGPEDFEAAFATAKQRNAQGLFDLGGGLSFTYRSRITAYGCQQPPAGHVPHS